MNWFSSSRGLAGGDAAGAGPALATHQERTEALRSAMTLARLGIHFQGILPEGLASQLRPGGRAGAPASFFPPA